MFYKTAVFKENSSFVYQASVIHTLRGKLFNLYDYEKLIDADLETALNFLAERNFTVAFKNNDDIFRHEEQKLLKLILTLIQDIDTREYFLAPLDFFNLKLIHKGLLKQESFENLKFGPRGLLNELKLQKIFNGENNVGFPPCLLKAVSEFNFKIQDQTPFEVDLLWEKLLQLFLLDKATALNLPYLIKLHSLEIDLLNLLNLFRAKFLGKDVKFYQRIFIPAGKLSLNTLSDLYKEEPELINAKLSYLDFAQSLHRGIDGLKKNQSLSDLEKELKNFYFSFLNRATHVIFGQEGIFAYYWLKRFELSNLRLILTAKENKIQKNWVLNSLRI